MSKRYFQIGLLSVFITVLFGIQMAQAGSQESSADPMTATEETQPMLEGAEETQPMMKGTEESEATSESKAGETEESQSFTEKVKSLFK